MTNREMYNERDLLEDNIDRMFLTDNIVELNAMESYARIRLQKIYKYNFDRLLKRNQEELEELEEKRNGKI